MIRLVINLGILLFVFFLFSVSLKKKTICWYAHISSPPTARPLGSFTDNKRHLLFASNKREEWQIQLDEIINKRNDKERADKEKKKGKKPAEYLDKETAGKGMRQMAHKALGGQKKKIWCGVFYHFPRSPSTTRTGGEE